MTTHKHEIEEAERSMEPPPETTAAIKLTRADAVKLVAADMIAQCANDVSKCEAEVIKARDEFRAFVIESARARYGTAISAALGAVGSDVPYSMCNYRVYEDGSDSGDSAQVVFSDHQQTYEARLRMAVNVPLAPMACDLAGKWLTALLALKAARLRDLRVGAMKKEARDLLIKAALAESEEGMFLRAAVKVLAKALKGKA